MSTLCIYMYSPLQEKGNSLTCTSTREGENVCQSEYLDEMNPSLETNLGIVAVAVVAEERMNNQPDTGDKGVPSTAIHKNKNMNTPENQVCSMQIKKEQKKCVAPAFILI